MKLKDYKKKKMQDPEFVKAYEEIQPEMNVIRAMIEARTSLNLTQKELSERTGIAQTEISRLENGKQGSKASLLVEIADKLGLDPIFVLRGMTAASDDDFLVRETNDLMRRLVPSKRVIVYRLADALLKEDE